MALELDERQRAMLQEMGVQVWLPQSASVPSMVTLEMAPQGGLATASERALRATLEGVQPAAATQVPCPAQDRATPSAAHSLSSPPMRAASPTRLPAVPSAATQPLELAALSGDALAQAAAACEACGLCVGRKNTTLLALPAKRQADWLVLGDPPDEDEDRLGQAFAEQSGALLDNMLKAVGASRSGQGRQGAHLSNVVKCRPPNGRVPQAAELAQCAQYLQREMELVQPRLILAMGRFATQLLLQEHPQEAALPLGKQRGRVYQYRGIPVVVTYHPKVLLRASADKAKAWADLCLALDVLDGRAASLQ